MPRAYWMSSLLTPAATIGHTMASRDTWKSMTTGWSLICSRALDRRVDLVRVLHADAHAAVGVGELDEVRDVPRAVPGVQVGVGVPGLVEQRLPLAHHAERGVVDQRHLDGDVVDRAGRELLVGHLEAAVAVDRPHGAVGLADLGAHRGRDRVAHGAQAARVEPRVRPLVADELRGPHLVLAHARRRRCCPGPRSRRGG